MFIECVNDDPLLLDASIRRKTRLPEFANMTQEEALEINAEQYQMLMQGLEIVARHPIEEVPTPEFSL